jgi:hypothetical protein
MADFGGKRKVVIVTGGTGLVGKAIEEIIGQESKIEGESFIFLGYIPIYVCVYVYIYMCICIYTCVYVYIHMYIYTSFYIYVYIYLYTCLFKYINIYVHVGSKDGDLRDKDQTRAIFEKHQPTHCIHVRMSIYIYVYTYMNLHIDKYIRMYVYTCIRTVLNNLFIFS